MTVGASGSLGWRPGHWTLFTICLLLWTSLPAAMAQRPDAPLRAALGEGVVVVLDDDLGLEVVPQRGEGLLSLAERVCGDRDRVDQLRQSLGRTRLLAGVRYPVPWTCVQDSLRRRAVRALFPQDTASADAWEHRVGAPTGAAPETLWRVADWFTGRGDNYQVIRAFNQLPDETIEPGQVVRIPRGLLKPGFLLVMPAAPVTLAPSLVRPTIETTSDLRYGQDGRGRFAGYRLRAGEALYSAVVVRFTGRLLADDVNPLAHEIARRSGISDLTDIPIGYEVKIPLEYLSAEFLPPDDPQRVAYEREQEEARRYTNTVRSTDLRGVTVILDAGHGGLDIGSGHHSGVAESVYVYDIMERVRRQLERRTAARVVPTTDDGPRTYQIPELDVLPLSKRHRVLTTPPYHNVDSRVSANLRWSLTNATFSHLVQDGTDPGNVIFVSIHADWLHSSVRGSMVYVPGLLPLRSNYRLSGGEYRLRKESREHGTFKTTHPERVKSLGLSKDLASNLMASVRRRGLAIHPNQPIRDRIYRGRSPWVPAVLKYGKVPAKVLVEVCNLANKEDLALIQTQTFREEFASALVDGILGYYGVGASARPTAAP